MSTDMKAVTDREIERLLTTREKPAVVVRVIPELRVSGPDILHVACNVQGLGERAFALPATSKLAPHVLERVHTFNPIHVRVHKEAGIIVGIYDNLRIEYEEVEHE